jgi:hypothetical protein
MDENIPNDIIEKLKKIGVKNFDNPSPDDIVKIMNAILKSKEIDASVFKSYVDNLAPQNKILFEGLQTFAISQKEISKSVMDIINNAINILGAQLDKAQTVEERKEIRDDISKKVEEARIESDKQREFIKRLALIGGGVALAGLGVAAYFVTRGKNTEMLTKGIQMVSKAI